MNGYGVEKSEIGGVLVVFSSKVRTEASENGYAAEVTAETKPLLRWKLRMQVTDQ